MEGGSHKKERAVDQNDRWIRRETWNDWIDVSLLKRGPGDAMAREYEQKVPSTWRRGLVLYHRSQNTIYAIRLPVDSPRTAIGTT